MTPRQFLLLGGILFVLLGVLGLFVLGPTADQSMLHDFFWLDNKENFAHLLFGVVALVAYNFLKDAQMIKWLVALVGVVALFAAGAGFMNEAMPVPNAGLTNLEMSDNLLHIAVAVWAFYVSFMGDKK